MPFKNKEDEREYRRKYYEANRDRFAQQGKVWRAANIESNKAYQKQWRDENPDKLFEYRRRYRQNPSTRFMRP